MQIPRIPFPSAEQFEADYLRPGRPVVLTGLLQSWPSWGQWSLDWFDQHYGGLVLSGNNSLQGTRTVQVSHYLQGIRQGKNQQLYLDAMPLDWLPGMAEAIQIPIYCPRDRHCQTLVWVGPAGTCLDFHKDNHAPEDGNQNLLAQLVGSKRVVLVSPQHDDCMYPAPQQPGDYLRSQIRLDHPDPQTFPCFERATLHETVVEAGEVLYIPAHWWHYVRSLQTSMTVTFWWRASRLIELLRRFKEAARNGSLEAFLDQQAGSLTPRDLEELGGVKVFHSLWQPLTERVRTLCQRLLSQELQALVQLHA